MPTKFKGKIQKINWSRLKLKFNKKILVNSGLALVIIGICTAGVYGGISYFTPDPVGTSSGPVADASDAPGEGSATENTEDPLLTKVVIPGRGLQVTRSPVNVSIEGTDLAMQTLANQIGASITYAATADVKPGVAYVDIAAWQQQEVKPESTNDPPPDPE